MAAATTTTETKIAFITGANRGIGYQTALGLAEKGVHVVIGARTAEAGRGTADELKSKGFKADALVYDATKPDDVVRARRYFEEKFGRLDILVNNAGVMLEAEDATKMGANQTSRISRDILEKTFATNFFGVVELTQALVPLLKKSPAGRVVNLSSILGSQLLHATPGSPIYDAKNLAYDASKTALNSFTIHLAHELKDTNVKVNSAHPGWVQTRMGGASAPMPESEGGRTSIALALLGADGPTGGFFHQGETLPW